MHSTLGPSIPVCLMHHSLMQVTPTSEHTVFDTVACNISHPFQARLCQMGCYGLGISRLMQAMLQHSCDKSDDDNISWPLSIAPYLVCVLPLTTSQVNRTPCTVNMLHVGLFF